MDLKYRDLEEFKTTPTRLSDIADRYGLRLLGDDIEIVKQGVLGIDTAFMSKTLSYVLNEKFIGVGVERGLRAFVAPQELKHMPIENFSLLLTDRNPEETFYRIFSDSVNSGEWGRFKSKRGTGNVIAETAVIHDSVIIGNDCRIMDFAVIFPNTRLGDRVVIEPHAVVGLESLMSVFIDARLTVVPSAGGTWLGDDVLIGASSVVKKAQFGDYNYIGKESKIAPLVSVGHIVKIGERTRVLSNTNIAGSARIGSYVRIAPGCSILQSVDIDDHSFVGIGSVVTRSIPKHCLAFGSPAKTRGWACCHQKLNVFENKAKCIFCGHRYEIRDDELVELG